MHEKEETCESVFLCVHLFRGEGNSGISGSRRMEMKGKAKLPRVYTFLFFFVARRWCGFMSTFSMVEFH